jgi:hypothetical protein
MAKSLKEFAHYEFLDALSDYTTIRDCVKGSRAVKAAGDAYLPVLKGQSMEDYENYKKRALFFPITGKTCSTLIGLATSEPPKVEYPSGLSQFFVDTAADYQFTETYVRAFNEVLMMGRYGLLIDAPLERSMDLKICPYVAENIVYWATDYYGRITDLLLREYVPEKPDNAKSEFALEMDTEYRRCQLVDGVYTVTVLDDDLEVESGPMVPLFNGAPIDYIPFVTIGSGGVHVSVDRPPMLDIATINVAHYMNSADLEWGRHITGLPTPVVSGVESNKTLKIGGTTAWVLPDPQARAYFLEFQGQGLQSLEKGLEEKIGLMATMSARLIDTSTKGSEAAETVRLRYMSETASLVHVIGAVESGLNILYNMLASLYNEGPVTIKFNREIVGTGLTYKDMAVLFDAYFKGVITADVLTYNLRRLKAVDPSSTDEEITRAIPSSSTIGA